MRRGATLLVPIVLAAFGCGVADEKAEGEWDADSICDEPGLEWACEEPEEATE